jgi:hypothetical protein
MEKTINRSNGVMGGACLNSMEKAFMSGSQIAKSVKAFALESFLLYHNIALWL